MKVDPVNMLYTSNLQNIICQLCLNKAGGGGGSGDASSKRGVLEVYYLASTLGVNIHGREGKEAGSGGKKVHHEIVSTKASANPLVISGAGMALQSRPA